MAILFSYFHAVASAPTSVETNQVNLTTIRVSWSPPNPLRDTTGYIITYTGGSSGNVTVSGPNIDNYLLTGLYGGHYTISIMGMSEHYPSDSMAANIVDLEVRLCKCFKN